MISPARYRLILESSGHHLIGDILVISPGFLWLIYIIRGTMAMQEKGLAWSTGTLQGD